MGTVIYKTNALIDGDINMKYWVVNGIVGTPTIYLIDINSPGYLTTTILSYNGELTGTNLTLDSMTTDEKGNHVYKYIASKNLKQNSYALTFEPVGECDKILIEAVAGMSVYVGSGSNSRYASMDINNYLLHSPRAVFPYNASIGGVNLQVKGNLSSIRQLLPYYNTLILRQATCYGSIEDLGYLNINDYVYGDDNNYTFAKLDIRMFKKTNIRGQLETVLDIYKNRGAKKFILHIYGKGTYLTYDGNSLPENLYAVYDSNGDYTVDATLDGRL